MIYQYFDIPVGCSVEALAMLAIWLQMTHNGQTLLEIYVIQFSSFYDSMVGTNII